MKVGSFSFVFFFLLFLSVTLSCRPPLRGNEVILYQIKCLPERASHRSGGGEGRGGKGSVFPGIKGKG